MLLEDVKINSSSKFLSGRVLWDGGSNRVLINNQFAKDHKLRRQEITYRLSVVGGKETVERGVVYEVELLDNNGQVEQIWGFGIDQILEPPDPVDLKPIRTHFPHIPDSIFDPHSKKRIDILVGLNFFSLHPSGGQGRNCVNNLKVLHSRFSKGWLIGGTHPDLHLNTQTIPSSALTIARVCRVEIKLEFSLNTYTEFQVEFSESELIGVLPPKRCCRCMICSECKDSALIHSRKEQDELDMLMKSIKLEDGQLIVSYPFLKNPESFPNNRSTVLSMAQKQEVRLQKKDLLDRYNAEFEKYITRGVVVPISKQEMEEYCDHSPKTCVKLQSKKWYQKFERLPTKRS